MKKSSSLMQDVGEET